MASVCAYCGVGCGVLLDVEEGRLVGVRGNPASPVSGGSLCVKGQFGWQFVHSDERLTAPLVRRKGKLEPASLDEALDTVATRLAFVKTTFGPEAMVFWLSCDSLP